jgi:myo-inositol-1(or 4)-monophosphatase
MNAFIADCARAGGEVLRQHFGRVTQVRTKESLASVVTEADVASERRIFERIQARFPDDGLLGEETGRRPGTSERVWIVDPLDGTSNFVAGLPWFGTMIALLERGAPVLAALYLPVGDTLYTAEAGRGAWMNGEPIRVTDEAGLANLLIAYSLDASGDPAKTRRDADLLVRVVNTARNVRATNSLVDFCYTAEGKLGGAINQACKLWDVAAPWLLVREAGGVVTGVRGHELDFRLDAGALGRTHTMLAAAPAIHRQLLELAEGQ